MRRLCILLSLVLTLPLAGCPTSDKNNDEAPPPATHDDARYVPMSTGDRWVYDYSASLGAPMMMAFGNDTLFQISGITSINGLATMQLDTPALSDYALVNQSRYLRATSHGLWEYFMPSQATSVVASPVQLLRFPLIAGDSYATVSKLDQDANVDLDNDGLTERRDERVIVTIVGQEAVSTPAGDFTRAWKVRRRNEWRMHYSTGRTTETTVVTDEWLVKDVGVVKRDFVYTTGSGSSSPQLSEYHYALLRYAVNGIRSESTPPQVQQVGPAAGSINPPSIHIGASFDELLDIPSLDANSIRLFDESGMPVAGEVNGDHKTVWFLPYSPLAIGNYTVRIEGITDAIGNAIAPQEWTITVVPVEACDNGNVYVCWQPSS
ncbi:MAG TPA: hypothetical protein DF427_07595 [Moraxellaceae bacterium]|nr:hypothetical protein [Moraxellaceae bacterium]